MIKDGFNLAKSKVNRTFKITVILSAILMTSMGLSCDSSALTAFRQEAASSIGDGIKTIVDGVIDGLIAAVEDAGDGSNSSNDNSSS